MRFSYLFATLATAIGLFSVSVSSVAGAQSSGGAPTDDALTPAQRRAALALARALDRRLTIWRTDSGDTVHVRHCRKGPEGCRKRLATLARWIVEVSQRHELDPFLLGAIAVRESGLNPFARGTAGERGILQLHPDGVGHGKKFVRSEAFRRACRRHPGACQREILEVGAKHLVGAIDNCDSIEAALGAYNSGVCTPESRYVRKVLQERQRLLELAKAPGESGAESMLD